MRFAKRSLTDEPHATAASENTEHIGEIRIEIVRYFEESWGEWNRRKRSERSRRRVPDGTMSNQPLSEKALKGRDIAHQVGIEERKVSPRKLYCLPGRETDSPERPWMCFTFRYRSERECHK